MLAPSIELKVEALYDCWAFLELIKFHGGTQSFEQCHFDFMLVLQAPQLAQSGRLAGDLYKRWVHLTRGEYEEPTPFRFLKYPRGHYKSTLIIGWILWRIYRNPNIAILQATNIRDLSEAFIREIRSYFEDEYLQQAIWDARPHIRGKLVPQLDRQNNRAIDGSEAEDKKLIWTSRKIQVLRGIKRKEATLESTSVNSRSTGLHYDIVILDDIVDFKNTETEGKIRTVKRWAGDVSSLLTRHPTHHNLGVLPNGTRFNETTVGERVVTGTHYNPNDYYVFLKTHAEQLKITSFERNIYKNGVDNSEGYLFSLFNEELEQQLREELSETPGVFEAQYLNHVNNPALQILSTSFVTWVSETTLLEGRSDGLISFINPSTKEYETFRPIIAIDPAISLSARADFTAIAVGGWSSAANLIVCDLLADHFTPEKAAALVVELVRKWQVSTAYCETVSFQSLYKRLILSAVIEAKLRCGVLDYLPNKWGRKEKRIEVFLSPPFNSGKVLFTSTLQKNSRVLNTFDFFGRGGRDDPPDAVAVVAEKSVAPSIDSNRFTSVRTQYHNQSFNKLFGGIY